METGKNISVVDDNISLRIAVSKRLSRLGYDVLSAPFENRYIESFNGKSRQKNINGEIFYSLTEDPVPIEHWRLEYNMIIPHSYSNFYPPALKSWLHLVAEVTVVEDLAAGITPSARRSNWGSS